MLSAAVLFAGCSVEDAGTGTTAGTTTTSGEKVITADGSSTVGPITSRIGEMFEGSHSDVQLAVTITGTGTGFGRFSKGETDISNASRRIKDAEKAECATNGIEFVELTIAMDGISIVVNKDNDFIDAITVAQLKAIWEPDSKIKTWKDLNAEWPDEEIRLFGPGRESGTFDYFTEKINGEEGASRKEYSPSADDNQLVVGVAGNKFALGYFGYGYYEKSKDKLKVLKVSATDSPDDAVLPTPESIQSGDYKPLARPVFVYFNKASLKRPEVAEFARFCLNEGQVGVPDVGCVRISATDLEASQAALEEALK